MSIKWLGAIMILAACGGFGFYAVGAYKHQESSLFQFVQMLEYMTWELEYRLTPLPELCVKAAHRSQSSLGQFFRLLSLELEAQTAFDVERCVSIALSKVTNLPSRTVKAVQLLGVSLGQYDLEGQIKGLESVKRYCQQEMESLSIHREERLRSYRVLGVCAGAMLVILFV